MGRRIHGENGLTPEWLAWISMRRRCRLLGHKDTPHYVGRGITIDPAWDSYKQFLADMGRKPTPQHTLERVDNNLGYSASNCVWDTRETQTRNRRYTKLTLTLANDIRRKYASGMYSQRELAYEYGTWQSTISHIVHNRQWT